MTLSYQTNNETVNWSQYTFFCENLYCFEQMDFSPFVNLEVIAARLWSVIGQSFLVFSSITVQIVYTYNRVHTTDQGPILDSSIISKFDTNPRSERMKEKMERTISEKQKNVE